MGGGGGGGGGGSVNMCVNMCAYAWIATSV